MRSRSTIFHSGDECFHADTCAPLVAAHKAGKLMFAALTRGSYPGRRLPKDLLTGTSSIGFWDAPQDQAWGLGIHRNEGIEITYLENGHLEFTVDGKPYSLEPGHVTVTRPWQPHSVGAPTVKSSRLYWVIIDVEVRQPHQPWRWPSWLVLSKSDLNELTSVLRENEHPVWDGNREIHRCFTELGHLVAQSQDHEPKASRLTLVVNELLMCLLDLLRAQKPHRQPGLTLGERSVAMFLEILIKDPAQPWTLEAMAERSGLGRTRFAHYCRKLTNMAPMTYLQHVRMEEATRRLGETQAPITDIALDCGFSSSAYFSRVFRLIHHCAPSEYRQRHRNQQRIGKRSA